MAIGCGGLFSENRYRESGSDKVNFIVGLRVTGLR